MLSFTDFLNETVLIILNKQSLPISDEKLSCTPSLNEIGVIYFFQTLLDILEDGREATADGSSAESIASGALGASICISLLVHIADYLPRRTMLLLLDYTTPRLSQYMSFIHCACQVQYDGAAIQMHDNPGNPQGAKDGEDAAVKSQRSLRHAILCPHLECIRYNGATIQMLDILGNIYGAKDCEDRGRQVIAVAKTCHLVLLT